MLPGLRISVSHPAGSSIVRDHLAGAAQARTFLGDPWDAAASFEAKAAEVDARFDRDARRRAADALTSPGPAATERLERFVEEGGYLVTTGQQPGLFGGPLYGVHKALTAVRLAEALEARLGRPVLPVFWVASEDHDWAEANHAHLVGVDNELHRFELPSPDPSVTPALHRIRLDGEIERVLASFLGNLPPTDFRSRYEEILRTRFRAGTTLPEAYEGAMLDLLGRFGLFSTDAAHPVVKERSADVLLRELDRAEEMEGILRDTAARLGEAGYDLQVPVLEGGVNLFLEGPAGRERLYREDGGYRLRTSGRLLGRDEILAAHRRDPAALSPNVLLRPVVESAVFPTLAYVAGPGETAYWAQLRDYFEAHGIRMPVVHPRWAAQPLEAKVRKVLEKFDLEPDALRRPFHEIAQDLARSEVPPEIRETLGRLRGAAGKALGEVQSAAAALDPTLKGPTQHARAQIFGALEDLERKIVQAVKRESEISLAQLEKARVHLFPEGRPGERVHNPFYYLVRYGDAFLDELHRRFEVRPA